VPYTVGVNSCCQTSPLDHYLIARAQACLTGANAHDLYSLLGNYYGLCLLAAEDESVMPRVEKIEQKLRAFCHSSQMEEGPSFDTLSIKYERVRTE
jgi:hypothetical protein